MNLNSLPRKNPIQTRERLLTAAFSEIYTTGFQGSDLNSILGRAGVTKGALYHHFGSKEALGHAVIDQFIAKITSDKWLAPLDDVDDPIDALIGIVEGTSFTEDDVAGGCPLNNLAQEMSPVDDGFRLRLNRLFGEWIGGVSDALRLGQANGKVRRDIDAREAAMFMVAAYEGFISLAKTAQDPALLRTGVRQVVVYLNGLRP
jgi:TetR/AcrR family transcriptional regulator, transcriptional repressor for nem operon